MKRKILPLILLLITIGFITFSQISYAQDFDSIAGSDDFSITEGETASITWIVKIESVVDPKYDVYIDGEVYIANFTWVLNDGTGIISINVNTSFRPGSYSYVIFVRDGAGNEISDEVRVTIEAKSNVRKWLEEYWLWIIIVAIFIGSMVGMVFFRRKGFKSGESLLNR